MHSVCSPSVGGAVRIVQGVWDNLIGKPSCGIRPSTECSTLCSMARCCICASWKASAMSFTAVSAMSFTAVKGISIDAKAFTHSSRGFFGEKHLQALHLATGIVAFGPLLISQVSKPDRITGTLPEMRFNNPQRNVFTIAATIYVVAGCLPNQSALPDATGTVCRYLNDRW